MKVLITGGAGFIGCNTAQRLLARGDEVIIYDNLSRRGTQVNLDWLLRQAGSCTFVKGDIRDYARLQQVFAAHPDITAVIHLAAQVAVTTSVVNPREDFEINAFGTFNVLEAAREFGNAPTVIYASTNKVYGGMEEVKIVERNGRYDYDNLPRGVAESQLLDFHSPYGCSKGAADQYVRDYARIYDLPTVVLRQSCIYGYRQFGIEDQGWVAWFTIAALLDKPITIYGDGKQVRDVLFVDDLVDAYLLAIDNIDQVRGQVYNVGGGADNVMSLLELLDLLEKNLGKKIPYTYADWRPGDQRVFISDIARLGAAVGWRPRVGVVEGVRKLARWVEDNHNLVEKILV